jgi:hypothetical protein
MRKQLADNESWSTIAWVGRYADLAAGKSRWARALREEFREETDEEQPGTTRPGAAIRHDESDAFVDWLWEGGAARLCDGLGGAGA